METKMTVKLIIHLSLTKILLVWLVEAKSN